MFLLTTFTQQVPSHKKRCAQSQLLLDCIFIHNGKIGSFRRLKPLAISPKPPEIAYFRRLKAYLRRYPSLGRNRSQIVLFPTAATLGHRRLSSSTVLTAVGGAHNAYVQRPKLSHRTYDFPMCHGLS